MFITRTYLYCDGDSEECECQGMTVEASGGDPLFRTRNDYKRHMKEQDWIFMPENKAFCPECRKKLKL